MTPQRSGIDEHFEPAVSYALELKGWVGRITDLLDSGVGHYFRVDLIAVFTRLKNDPGRDHRLVRVHSGQTGEGYLLFYVDVIANAFTVFQGAVLLPYPARLLCDTAIEEYKIDYTEYPDFFDFLAKSRAVSGMR